MTAITTQTYFGIDETVGYQGQVVLSTLIKIYPAVKNIKLMIHFELRRILVLLCMFVACLMRSAWSIEYQEQLPAGEGGRKAQ